MKKGKILVAGIVSTILDVIVAIVCSRGIFSWVYRLEPISVWKPMQGHLGAVFVGILALNIIFVVVYVLFKAGIPGKGRLSKGLVFGLCVWAVGILPGTFTTYSFMTVATTVVIYWAVLGLIKTPLKGMIIAAIYGD